MQMPLRPFFTVIRALPFLKEGQKVYKLILQFWPKNKRSDIEMIRKCDIIVGEDMFSI